MHYNGKASCTACGVLAEAWAFEGFQTSFAHGYSPLSTLQQNQAYTRTKRFVKYLNRASMKQSMNSVPDATWKFLLKHAPYRDPAHISDAQESQNQAQMLRLFAAAHVPPVPRLHGAQDLRRRAEARAGFL